MKQNTKDFLLDLATLLYKYKVEIEITESCSGDWGGFSVDGLQFEIPYLTEDGFPLDDYVEFAGRFHAAVDIFDYVEKHIND
jgi:hypothetical protein